MLNKRKQKVRFCAAHVSDDTVITRAGIQRTVEWVTEMCPSIAPEKQGVSNSLGQNGVGLNGE